jgi:hypothetical protein
MRINSRGQLGPIGEDFLYYTLIFVLIAFFLLIALTTFADHESRYAMIDAYRLGQAYADKTAMVLAAHYKGDESAKWARVLDNEEVGNKLAGGACTEICDNCGICVENRRTGEKRFCGQSRCAGTSIDPSFVAATIRLPVALRMDDKKYDPGVLEVSLVR